MVTCADYPPQLDFPHMVMLRFICGFNKIASTQRKVYSFTLTRNLLRTSTTTAVNRVPELGTGCAGAFVCPTSSTNAIDVYPTSLRALLQPQSKYVCVQHAAAPPGEHCSTIR